MRRGLRSTLLLSVSASALAAAGCGGDDNARQDADEPSGDWAIQVVEAKFAKDEKGASMVEYILLVALIALAVIAAVVFLKDQVNGKFNDAGSKLSSSGSS